MKRDKGRSWSTNQTSSKTNKIGRKVWKRAVNNHKYTVKESFVTLVGREPGTHSGTEFLKSNVI